MGQVDSLKIDPSSDFSRTQTITAQSNSTLGLCLLLARVFGKHVQQILEIYKPLRHSDVPYTSYSCVSAYFFK